MKSFQSVLALLLCFTLLTSVFAEFSAPKLSTSSLLSKNSIQSRTSDDCSEEIEALLSDSNCVMFLEMLEANDGEYNDEILNYLCETSCYEIFDAFLTCNNDPTDDFPPKDTTELLCLKDDDQFCYPEFVANTGLLEPSCGDDSGDGPTPACEEPDITQEFLEEVCTPCVVKTIEFAIQALEEAGMDAGSVQFLEVLCEEEDGAYCVPYFSELFADCTVDSPLPYECIYPKINELCANDCYKSFLTLIALDNPEIADFVLSNINNVCLKDEEGNFCVDEYGKWFTTYSSTCPSETFNAVGCSTDVCKLAVTSWTSDMGCCASPMLYMFSMDEPYLGYTFMESCSDVELSEPCEVDDYSESASESASESVSESVSESFSESNSLASDTDEPTARPTTRPTTRPTARPTAKPVLDKNDKSLIILILGGTVAGFNKKEFEDDITAALALIPGQFVVEKVEDASIRATNAVYGGNGVDSAAVANSIADALKNDPVLAASLGVESVEGVITPGDNKEDDSSDDDNSLAIGLGVGLGVGGAAAAAAVGFYFYKNKGPRTF